MADVSYVPGTLTAVAGDRCLMLVDASPDSPAVAWLWQRIDQGAAAEAVLAGLLGAGFDGVPGFALLAEDAAGQHRLYCRGTVRGTVAGPAAAGPGPATCVDGGGLLTWREHPVSADAERIVLGEPPADSALRLPAAAGVLLAGCVIIDLAEVAERDTVPYGPYGGEMYPGIVSAGLLGGTASGGGLSAGGAASAGPSGGGLAGTGPSGGAAGGGGLPGGGTGGAVSAGVGGAVVAVGPAPAAASGHAPVPVTVPAPDMVQDLAGPVHPDTVLSLGTAAPDTVTLTGPLSIVGFARPGGPGTGPTAGAATGPLAPQVLQPPSGPRFPSAPPGAGGDRGGHDLPQGPASRPVEVAAIGPEALAGAGVPPGYGVSAPPSGPFPGAGAQPPVPYPDMPPPPAPPPSVAPPWQPAGQAPPGTGPLAAAGLIDAMPWGPGPAAPVSGVPVPGVPAPGVPVSGVPAPGVTTPDAVGSGAGETGFTVKRGDIAGPAARPAPPPDRIGPAVPALICPAGHVNPPSEAACRRCGAPLPHDTVIVPRPVLGVLRLSVGDLIALDRGVVMGRSPRADFAGSEGFGGADGGERPHVVKLPSADGDISRTHLKVTLDGWHVLVTDLNSTNGTLVTLPGHDPQQLRPGEPVPIKPGTVVTLADGIDFRYEVSE